MSIQRLNTTDVRNGVSHLMEKADALYAACELHDKKLSMQSEIALVVAAGDFEIEASNFADDLRKKLSAGVLQ